MSHRISNLVQSVGLLAILVLQVALVGWVFAGALGALLAVGLGVFAATQANRMPDWALLRMIRARPITVRQAPGLYEVTRRLSSRAGLSTVPRLALIASPVPNAMTVGTPEAPVIGLTQGLLRQLPERELEAVLAHEISHVAHRDLGLLAMAQAYGRITATAGQIGLFLVPVALLLGATQLAWVGMALALGPVASTALTLAVSRQREFAADGLAVELTGDPAALASALQRIEARGRWYARWFGMGSQAGPDWLRSHPATEARVERLRVRPASTR